MLEKRLKGEATGTEWRRSRSGVPDASGAAADEDISGVFEEMPDEEPAAVERPGLYGGPARTTSRVTRLVKSEEKGSNPPFSPEQRLLILDTWRRSGLPAKDFAAMVGMSPHTLYVWHKRFEAEGPAGLMDKQKGGPKGSRLSEPTRRAILMIKESHPDYGCERISNMLYRGPALPASPQAVARVLREEGYELQEYPTRKHPDKQRSFERARPNQLWQTDIFTFMLKRQNRRVYLIAFMDDNSRYMVGYGLHATQSSSIVLEVLRSAIASYGVPEEILTDNGSQYITWRGKSAFTKELEKRGIKQVVARPRHPQTLGKIERFWGTLWRECVETSVFIDLEDARKRIGHFMDYYNFQRTHQGIGGLLPADRFFHAAPEVLRTLKERVAANALQIARQGVPKPPLYLTGNLGGKGFSLHAEGGRMFLRSEDGERKEVDLTSVPEPLMQEEMPDPVIRAGSLSTDPPVEEPEPGVSAIDGVFGEDIEGGYEEDVDDIPEGEENEQVHEDEETSGPF